MGGAHPTTAPTTGRKPARTRPPPGVLGEVGEVYGPGGGVSRALAMVRIFPPVAVRTWSGTCTREHRQARRPMIGPIAGIVSFWTRTRPHDMKIQHIRAAAVLAALAAALSAGRAEAQVYSPPFMSPTPTSDFGIYVSDIGDVAVEGIWRRIARGGDIGVRAGYADTGEGALMLGIEMRNPVVLAGAPIGLAFTAGAQGLISDNPRVGGQVGFTAGQALPAGTITVTPYIHPRLALVASPDTDNELEDDDNFDLDVRADIGADLDFAAGVSLRFGINLAEGASWGLGLAWRR